MSTYMVVDIPIVVDTSPRGIRSQSLECSSRVRLVLNLCLGSVKRVSASIKALIETLDTTKDRNIYKQLETSYAFAVSPKDRAVETTYFFGRKAKEENREVEGTRMVVPDFDLNVTC